MCTDACPCPAAEMDNYWHERWLANLTLEDYANIMFQRTIRTNTTPGYNPAYQGVQFVLGGANTFENFWECYLFINNMGSLINTQNAQNISSNFESFVRAIEGTFDCNGICYPGLFFYFKSVFLGHP